MAATYTIKISWRGSGTFTQEGDDVLGLGRVKPNVTITYGRDQSRALSPIAAGSASLRLNNISKDYSAENTASPLAGYLDPARPLIIGAQTGSGAYTLFYGHTDDFVVNPEPNIKEVEVTVLDSLADFREDRCSTDLFPAIRTGEAINEILDAIGWPLAKRDLDVGATTMRWWCMDDDEIWSSMSDIVNAEGPPALITIGTDGTVIFRDRHHRLIDSTSVTSQATFRDTGTEPCYSAPVSYDQGWRDVYNVINFSVDERDPALLPTDIWTSDRSYSVTSGQSYSVVFSTSDPFTMAVTPEDGIDYITRAGTPIVSLSRTAGKSATITITASGGDVVIDTLKVRGVPIQAARTVQIQQESPTSINRYGRKTFPDNVKLASLEDARALADIVLSYRQERLPTFSLTMIGDRDERLDQCFGRDLSDRVTIISSELGMTRDFFIEQISHQIPLGGLYHRTTFGCEATSAPSDTPFTFDDAVLGKFGTGKFASALLDSSSGIFIFDHPTQGQFGTGLFAT